MERQGKRQTSFTPTLLWYMIQSRERTQITVYRLGEMAVLLSEKTTFQDNLYIAIFFS